MTNNFYPSAIKVEVAPKTFHRAWKKKSSSTSENYCVSHPKLFFRSKLFSRAVVYRRGSPFWEQTGSRVFGRVFKPHRTKSSSNNSIDLFFTAKFPILCPNSEDKNSKNEWDTSSNFCFTANCTLKMGIMHAQRLSRANSK